MARPHRVPKSVAVPDDPRSVLISINSIGIHWMPRRISNFYAVSKNKDIRDLFLGARPIKACYIHGLTGLLTALQDATLIELREQPDGCARYALTPRGHLAVARSTPSPS